MNKVVDNYVLLDKLGAGQFAEVFKGKDRANDMQVAVKVYSLQKFLTNPKLKEMITNEIKALQDLNCSNIIHFYKMLKTSNNIYLVYEYCDSHTLEDYIISKKFLAEKEALNFMRQLSIAFKEMISKNIIHRDTKPSNILLTSTGVLKVADFGLCKFFDPAQEQMEKLETILNHAIEKTVIVGSPIYMAPELLKGLPINKKVDMYSLGIVFYEMLFGVCPFEDSNVENLVVKIEKGNLNFPLERNPISMKTQNLIREMLKPDPRFRMEWEKLFTVFEEYSALQNEEYPRTNIFVEKNRSFLEEKSKTKDYSVFTPVYGGENSNSGHSSKVENFSAKNENFTGKVESFTKIENISRFENTPKIENFTLKPEPFHQTKPDPFPKIESHSNKPENFASLKSDSFASRSENFPSIDKRLLKEKNKIVYLSNVINAALDLNLNTITVLAVLSLLRLQILVYEDLLDILNQELPKENHNRLLRVSYEEWIRYKRSEDHRVFTKICQDELILVRENLLGFFKTAQNDIKTLEMRYFELNREGINEVLFYYCKTVVAHGFLLLSENEKDLAKKILIHANNVLDSMGLEEFFEKLINEEVLKIDEQNYFGKLMTFPISKYLKLIDEKLAFFSKTLQKV